VDEQKPIPDGRLMEQDPLLRAIEHHRAGRLAEAEAIYREILAENPQDADALNLLGVIARQRGNLPAAIDLISQAVRLRPDFADAHGNLASVLKDAGQPDAAADLYRRTIQLNPNYAKAHHGLGDVLAGNGQLDEAIDSYRRAVQIKPDFIDAHYGLAYALLRNGDTAAAVDSYRRVIQLNPGDADAHNNLGIALKTLGRIAEAIESYRESLRLKPNSAVVHYNLGNAQRMIGQLDNAAESYQRAIQLKPDYADAYTNMGVVLAEQGRLDESIAHCRVALKLKPDNPVHPSNLLFALYHHPDTDARQLLMETRQWARLQISDIPSYSPPIVPMGGRRLKIGYLSPFLGMCADAHFIFPLLSHHDRKHFEIFCYSHSIRDDELTERMRSFCDHWLDMRSLGTKQAVERIRGDELDILVVMSRPADDCQMIMAHRIAPVQITWLTFASCTSGLETVDYRISDPYLDPPGMDESVYAEKTVRLPETAWSYDPLIESPPVKPLPAVANGYITFGSLNRLSKINLAVIETWAEVLRRTPNSRLHILANPGNHRQRLLDQFSGAGIEPGRIEFIDRQSRMEYLKQYDRIDLTLDTFPFGGHTTALDSLWMGVPVVTLEGRTSVGRAASSALHNLGLSQLVARTAEEFVSMAAGLAGDLKTLAELRSGLRQRMQKSALTDGARFARYMENIYRQLRQQLAKA